MWVLTGVQLDKEMQSSQGGMYLELPDEELLSYWELLCFTTSCYWTLKMTFKLAMLNLNTFSGKDDVEHFNTTDLSKNLCQYSWNYNIMQWNHKYSTLLFPVHYFTIQVWFLFAKVFLFTTVLHMKFTLNFMYYVYDFDQKVAQNTFGWKNVIWKEGLTRFTFLKLFLSIN